MPDAFLFLTTADTEILAAAKAVEGLPGSFPGVRCANPAKLEDVGSFLDGALPGTRAVIIRLLGGRRAWAEAFEYLRCGGVVNTANLLRFVADTLLFEGYGFDPPYPLPDLGVYHPRLG